MRYSSHFASALVSVALGASVAAAQADHSMAVELRPAVGVFIPSGAQATDFKSATLVGFQGALEVSKYVHGVLSGAWTRTHTKYATISNDAAYIWQFDAGLELSESKSLGNGLSSRPFVGAGFGLRTYDYAALKVGSSDCSAVYGSLGYELQRRDIALRSEARDYVSCFRSPVTGRSATRNDIGISIGLAYHIF
jgi:hypothetical protein